MKSGLRCLFGDAALARSVARACDEAAQPSEPLPGASGLLRDRPGRSQLFRVKLADGETLVAKRFLCADHRHPLRERAKAALGLAAGQREARALQRLRAAGVAVPELRLLARSRRGGDLLLATRRVEGETLGAHLAAGDRVSRGTLRRVGAAVGALHAAGFVHGDLHAGNILLTGAGPVLIDLQSARRRRGRPARHRDLAFLDHSLAPYLSSADRMRLRAAALGATAPFDDETRRALRSVGRRAEARRRSFARRRTRRSGAPGSTAAAFACSAGRGLRDRAVDPVVAAAALVASGAAGGATRPGWTLLKAGVRARVSLGPTARGPAVVKHSHSVGFWRAVADALRGSPARRAWLAGQGLRLRGIGAAAPWAYVEEHRAGLPRTSAIVVEAIAGGVHADACPATFARPEEVARALLELLLRLHRADVDHGDLKASHVLLVRRGDTLASRLVDLESLRFRRRLLDHHRIRALAQLNASLPDGFPDSLRRWVFDRYASALPFRAGRDEALRRIIEASLARRHRWSGGGCTRPGRFSG